MHCLQQISRCWTPVVVIAFAFRSGGPDACCRAGSKLATPAAVGDVAAGPQSIADLKALERKVQQVVAKVSASVVVIAEGSGVVVGSDGYVLTVAHVGGHAGRDVTVVFPDGRRARAVTLGNDSGMDAGMAKITDPGPSPYAAIGSSEDLKPGQRRLTLGYPVTFGPHGKPPLVRIGRVLAMKKRT